jgi:dethiobiotin synthetase
VPVLVVSGVGPDAPETLAAAAVTACAGGSVTVVKLAQCGPAGALAEITRLTRVADVHELARYRTELPPHAAAAADGLPELELAEAVREVVDLDATHDEVVVAGAGGLAVPFSTLRAWTVVDLAVSLRASVLLVARPGRFDHVALSVARLADEGVPLAGVVLGPWPDEVSAALRTEVDDLDDLAPTGALAGLLPGDLARAGRDFAQRSRAVLSPRLGGRFDWPSVRATL